MSQSPGSAVKQKKVLRQGIVEGIVPNSMPAEDVYEMCDLFKLYEFVRFKDNLKSLRAAVARDYDRMAEDAEAFGHNIALKDILQQQENPPPPLPYPNWDTHTAKYLLRQPRHGRWKGKKGL